MSRVLVHSFNYGPQMPLWPDEVRIDVFLQDGIYVTAEAHSLVDGDAGPIPGTVEQGDLGFDPDSSYYFECQGTSLVNVLASLNSPFGYLSVQEDSESCEATPGPCFVIFASVTHTDETLAGMRDGAITADVAFTHTDGEIQYSLDNINWQSSGSFIGLYPGNYQLRVRRGENCRYVKYITIAAGAEVAEAPPFPWQNKYCSFFKLIRDGVEYPVSEPIKWDQVNIIGKRSKDYHGWLYQHSDGIIELAFDCPAGMEVLEAEYADKGSDGEVFFQYGYSYGGQDYVLLDSKINFNTRKLFPGYVTASIERSDMNQLFTSRIDTKVKMNQALSVGDVAITPPASYETTLHAKELVRNFSHITPAPIEGFFDSVLYDVAHPLYMFFDTLAAQVSEITAYYGKTLSLSDLQPDTVDNYLWLLDFDATFNINAAFDIRSIWSRANPEFGSYADTMIVQLFLNVNGVEYPMSGPQSVHWETEEEFLFSIAGEIIDMDLKQADKVYMYVKFTNTVPAISGTVISGPAYQENTNIVITSLEQSPTSQAKGWFIAEVLDHCIKAITDNQSELKSRFLSRVGYQFPTDGEGSLNFATNGKQIRNFNIAENPLTISTSQILSSLKAIYCIGFGFERVGTREVIRVERVGYFYQNRQILAISECFGYHEDTAKELLINEVEIGYETYQDSGYNTLDEANTRAELITPIKTNKEKLTAKSTLITSGYKIEDVRRQQFITTGKDSYNNDEDGFMISMRRVDGVFFYPEKNEAFAAVSGIISPETAYNLRLTPKRMLVNWAEWLRNCFHYKTDSDKIKTTLFMQNGKLTTQLNIDDVRPVGDINKLEWLENGEVTLADYLVTERIFRPEWIFFKARLTPDLVNTINLALMGRAGSDINYGYISVKDPAGNYQAGFPYELEYNFYTEEISIKMLKKYDNPVDPEAECCAPLMVNGCTLKVNGNNLILQ